MTTLIYQNFVRTESDPTAIARALAKGWQIQPAPPSVNDDQETYWEEGHWKIRAKPSNVPPLVPLWAFRASLALAGLKNQAEALIAALPEPQKTVATQQWEYGNFIERNHPLIESLGAQIGLTGVQIDDIFKTAESLT
jgi:hypothetical protein